MSAKKLKDELRGRWKHIFEAVVRGDDISLATRLRAEGLMEAAAILKIWEKDDQLRELKLTYCRVFGRGFEESFGFEWELLHPFPEIPVYVERAPVYPSTKDNICPDG